MGRKRSYLTVTDQFCGAGGSSQGVRRFAQRSGLNNGLEVRLAMNHWKLALETHNTNFPEAAHVATDISACNPRDYPSTDILITSPECTNHSVAKGKKQVKVQLDLYEKLVVDPAAERSRATMWDVHRFAEFHKYRIIITENVVDARAWIGWRGWITAMQDLGYHYHPVFFNSMFAWPTPQSRDRMYVVFWRKGQKKPDLDIRPKAHCAKCGMVEAVQSFKPKANVKAKYGRQYLYVCPSCAAVVTPFYFAAINAIDWTLPAERIGDRKTPLKPRTLERIAYGLKKYGNRPLSVSMLDGQNSTWSSRVKDATADPMNTQHSQGSSAIASPFIMHNAFGGQDEHRSRSIESPMFSQTGNPIHAVVSPFTVNMRGTRKDTVPHSPEGMDEAMGTQTAKVHHALLSPFLVQTKYSHSGPQRVDPADGAMAAQTGQQSLGVAMPFVLDSSFTKGGGKYMNGGDEPMNTQATTQSKGVVIPPGLMVDTNYFTDHNKPLDGPLPAQTSANKLGIAFLLKQRGTDEGHVKSAAIGLDEPVGTISAGGNHHALISGKAMGFLQSFYGNNPVYNGMDEAMGTVATHDRHALVTGQKELEVEDLYFRMLRAHEVKAGMAFDPDYVVLGNQRDQVKQLGNAVTPPVMEILVERCIETLM